MQGHPPPGRGAGDLRELETQTTAGVNQLLAISLWLLAVMELVLLRAKG
jgi:hypothetical protein